MRLIPSLAVLVSIFLCSGCGAARLSAWASPAASRPALSEEAAIQTALQQIQTKKVDYKIAGADLLDVTVFQQPDLNRKVRVSQNGTISLPLAGAVKVGGLALADAEAALKERLKDYLRDPQVTLFISEYGNRKIFVLGEVKSPGSYELPAESRLTVLEAVSLAGGFTQIAAQDRTKVIRTRDGQSQTLTIEISAITRRGEKQKDVPLEASDVVYVPQSFF